MAPPHSFFHDIPGVREDFSNKGPRRVRVVLIRKGLMDVFGQVNHLDKGLFVQMGIHLLEVLNLESMPNLPGTSRDLHTI